MNNTTIDTNSDEDFIVVNEVNKFQKISNELYKHNNKLLLKKLIKEIKLFKQQQNISLEVTRYHITKLEKQLNTTNSNKIYKNNNNNNNNKNDKNNDICISISPKKRTLVDIAINTPPVKRNKINHNFKPTINVKLSSNQSCKTTKRLINNTTYNNSSNTNNFCFYTCFKEFCNYIEECWNNCCSFIKKIFN